MKEKGNDFLRLNEISMGYLDFVQREVVYFVYLVEEKKVIKLRDIMSVEYRIRISSILSVKEMSKVLIVSEQFLMGVLQLVMF